MPSISIEPRYCKGCGYCIPVCPKGLIQIGSQKNHLGLNCAEQPNSEGCTACMLCSTICPDSAITVYK